MTAKDNIRCPVIYLQGTQSEGDAQRNAIHAYIRQRPDLFPPFADSDSINMIAEYTDILASQHSPVEQALPSLSAFIRECAARNYDCIIFYSLAAFPDSWQGEWLFSLLTDQMRLRILSVSEGFDSALEEVPAASFPSHGLLETPAAFLPNPVVTQIYQNPLLREDTGENANNSAFSAYGYLFDPDIPCMMKPDPATASVVQKVFQMHLSGILTNQIATFLTKEGIPSPITRRKQMGTTFHHGSSHWSYVSILKILQNRTYIGEHIYRLPKLPRHMKKQAEEETPILSGTAIPHHHPALITEKDFEAAQILLKYRPKQVRKPQTEKYSCTPFTNLVFCGACGRPMLHRHKKQSPTSRSAYLCVSAAKHLPDACPCISHPTDDLISAARSSILQECRQTDKVRDALKEGTGSASYLNASEDIRRKIIEILDLARNSAAEKPETFSSSLSSDGLPEALSALVEEKHQLIKLFTEENAWLRDFALPEDFVLDRKTAKQLIQRIDVYPDGKTIVTLRDQADKEQLLRYL